jgi:sugar lactone lactonase YvrE
MLAVFTGILIAANASGQQTATPAISPGPGTYSLGIRITITDATPGAVIYYSEHNVLPTTASTRYTGPISISGTVTVRAIAIAPAHTLSQDAASLFVELPAAAAPQFLLGPGSYSYNTTVPITAATPNSRIYYTTDGTTPTTSSRVYNSPVALRGRTVLSAIAVAPETEQSHVTTATYTVPAPAPVLSPAGFSTLAPAAVKITNVLANATMYYTTDGSTPTTSSTRYTGPVTVSQTENLQAIAVAPSYSPSATVSGAYVIQDVFNEVGFGPFRVVGYSGPIGDGGPPVDASLDAFGMAFDKNGNFYVADNKGNRIRKVSVSTGLITTFAGTGPYLYADGSQRYGAYSGDGGPATDAGLSFPTGIAIDSKSNVYFSDTGNNVVRRIDAVTGIITTVVGTGACCGNYSGDGGLASKAQLFYPTSLYFDANDNLFIADTGNSVIRRVDAVTGIIETIVGKQYDTGNPYQPTYCHYSGDSGAATNAELCQPNAIAFDAQGNLFISDSQNNVIRKVSAADGSISTVVGPSANLYNPTALAIDKAGNLFISDDFEIYELDAASGHLFDFTGYYSFTDGLPRTQTQVLFPVGLIFDEAGNLYFSQSENYYSGVRKISLSATPTPLF